MRILPLSILFAGIALAQPAEDPGLAETPAPPPPAPVAAPKPVEKEAPPPATVEPPKSESKATTLTPAERAVPPPAVDESVSEKVDFVAPDKTQIGELDDHVAAPTVTGGVGLLRTQSAAIGRQGSFRIGLHMGVFTQDSLIAGGGSGSSDSNTRWTGDLSISYTPWKYLEAYFGLYNTSNQNDRNDPGRTDNKLLTSLADFAFGLKGRIPVARFFDLGVRAEVKFLESVNSSGVEANATNASFDALATLDLRHIDKTKNVPLRFHLNFGYLYDNSVALLPGDQCATSVGNDACIRSRAVEEFAYGIGNQRLRLALAADAPLQPKGVGVEPFFEYHLEAALGDGDPVFKRALPNNNGQLIQYATLGLRVRPIAGLILDAGVDIGLQSPGYQYGPPVPAWNLILGAGYAYEFGQHKTKVVTRTIVRETKIASSEGRLRGVIKDAATKKPIGGASIKYVNRLVTGQISGEDGTFLSYGFTPGPIKVEIARDDYEPLKTEVRVAQNGETSMEVLLAPRPPPAGQMRVRVTDPAGGPIGMATVRVHSPSGKPLEADNDGAGAFSAKVSAGEYTVDVFADNFLGTAQHVNVTAGQVQALSVTLPKKPSISRIMPKPDEIGLKTQLKFGATNDLAPDSQLVLDEVADFLIKNPQVKRLRIEAHTDNKGDAEKNLAATRARAEAVSNYLQKRGIDPSRLTAEGFGGSQPLVPNLTAANRAKNRRVTFKILETD